MYVVYNVIWIICIVLLFLSLLSYMRRRRNEQIRACEAQEQLMQVPAQAIIIDMNARPQQQQTYRPPESNIEQPPPSYQDYSKDHRVQT